MSERKPVVRIVTLGCAKNDVDSEEIAGVIREAGYEVDGRHPRPDVTVVNTCGFLEASKRESLEAIRKAVRTKGRGKVIVAGCLVQRLGPELERLVPGADAYVGVGQMARFAELVERVFRRGEAVRELEPPHHRWAAVGTRLRSGAPWSAYLKVSEGCDHRCTFCTIPSFRGKHVSKPLERVLEEARHLVRTGARELNLVAQDVTQYGYDLYGRFTLPRLLRELDAVEGVEWIRLLYFYPSRLGDEVIEAMARSERVLPYIDIPLQHVHRDVLRRMRRPGDAERYLRLFEKLRAAMPECAIRTTFIVGFPGETEAEFESLLEFLDAAQLDRVGAFSYSREPGTPSADMPDQVPNAVKKERFDRLMRRQRAISRARNEAWVGRQLRVLVEEARGPWSIGRSFRDAPDIDGQVFVQGPAAPGSFVEVTVTEAGDYDLVGALAGAPVPARRSLKPLPVARRRAPL